jgi:hypothetical protein
VPWLDFDFLESEVFEFSAAAKQLVLQVFVIATEKLESDWQQYQVSYQKRMMEMADEGDIGLAGQELDWEEQLHRQRMQGIGSLALDWTMSLLQESLQRSKRYLNTSHPASTAPYTGKNWLARVANEYQQRFQIDFHTVPEWFDRIEELILARNAGVHRDRGNFKKYIEKTPTPRFADDNDEFWVSHEALVATIADCEKFLNWMVAELKTLRSPDMAD